MIFSEKTEIIYNEMYGVVDFVCDQYIVMEIPPKEGRNPARLIIFRENYKKIQITKTSGK